MKRYQIAAFAAAWMVAGPGATAARAQKGSTAAVAAPVPVVPVTAVNHAEPLRKDILPAPADNPLELTAAEYAKYSAAETAHGSATKHQWEREAVIVKKLEDQLSAKADEGQILATLASLRTVRREERAEDDRFEVKTEVLLTPIQRARLISRESGSQFQAHNTESKKLAAREAELVKTLAEQAGSKADGAEIRETLASLKTLRKAMRIETDRFEESQAATLTAAQRAQALVDGDAKKLKAK